jgi:hypothetical protein
MAGVCKNHVRQAISANGPYKYVSHMTTIVLVTKMAAEFTTTSSSSSLLSFFFYASYFSIFCIVDDDGKIQKSLDHIGRVSS